MTVLTVVQSAATVLAMDPIPDQVFGSTKRDMVEMRSLLNKVARVISKAHDWSALKGTATLTGNGSATDFALPANFARMTKDALLWSSANTTVPLTHVLSLNDWLAYETQGWFPPYGHWTVYGGRIHIKDARATGETIKFPFISNLRVVATDGVTTKPAFTADTDVFRLGGDDADDLLEAAVVWAWKSKKGIDYAEEMATYQDILAQCIGDDRGPAILTVGRQRYRGDTRIAFPGVLG